MPLYLLPHLSYHIEMISLKCKQEQTLALLNSLLSFKVTRKGANIVPNHLLKIPHLNIPAFWNKPSSSKTHLKVLHPYHSNRKGKKACIYEYISTDNWGWDSLVVLWESIWSGKPLGFSMTLKQTVFWVKENSKVLSKLKSFLLVLSGHYKA